MGSDMIIGVIGITLIGMSLMSFKKEMTLLKMECEGTTIENTVTHMQFAKVVFSK